MKKHRRAMILLISLIIIVGWLLWGNQAIEITEYTVKNEKIPAAFDGFRIVQVSDLHNDRFGEGQSRLVEKTRDADPDIIVITGDLIDSYRTDPDVAMEYVTEAVRIAPVYFIAGNHEYRLDTFSDLMKQLTEAGVQVLDNRSVDVVRGDDSLCLIGLMHPSLYSDRMIGGIFASLDTDPGAYRILLAHHPEYMEYYKKAGMDLVFAGHAHGGQFRLPLIGGVFAPGQGFFPKYDSGVFTEGNTAIVVSRGIGNSLFPLRVNNRPEVVVVVLKSGE